MIYISVRQCLATRTAQQEHNLFDLGRSFIRLHLQLTVISLRLVYAHLDVHVFDIV